MDTNRDYVIQNKAQIESETDTFTNQRYTQFHRLFPAGTKVVLDVGCNTGRGGQVLKDLNKNYEIWGMDVVQERLEQLDDKVYAKKILGSASDIPIEDNSVDAIVGGEFIEHLYALDAVSFLAEAFRVLKVGGVLLVTTPNPYDIKRKYRKESILGFSHVSQHFPDILKLQFKMSGFSKVKIFGTGKTSRYLGLRFPFLSLYGSYLAMGKKW